MRSRTTDLTKGDRKRQKEGRKNRPKQQQQLRLLRILLVYDRSLLEKANPFEQKRKSEKIVSQSGRFFPEKRLFIELLASALERPSDRPIVRLFLRACAYKVFELQRPAAAVAAKQKKE